jgi:hypothetical protein
MNSLFEVIEKTNDFFRKISKCDKVDVRTILWLKEAVRYRTRSMTELRAPTRRSPTPTVTDLHLRAILGAVLVAVIDGI